MLARLPLSIWFPIAVFALTRLVDALFILIASRHQIALTTSDVYYIHTPTPANPGYWSVITNWDGQWYERIASDGYPAPDNSVGPEAVSAGHTFNFLPLFPLLVGGLMAITGLGFAPAASIVSLTCGAAAMVVLFKVIEHTAGRFAACAGVALVNTFVSAPVMQVAYKESLVLFLLLLWFWWVQRRRYWWAVVAVLALAFAKQLTPPMALVIAAHAWHRWRHRSSEPIKRREWLGMVAILTASAAGLFAWDTLVRIWLGGGADHVVARTRGLADPGRSLGAFSQFYEAGGFLGLAFPVLAVVALIVYARSALTRSWGTELRTWLWAYPSFILAGSNVAPATLRYLLPAFPMALLVVGSPAPGTIPRLRVWLVVACCIVGLASQWWWIDTLLIVRQLLPPTPFVP